MKEVDIAQNDSLTALTFCFIQNVIARKINRDKFNDTNLEDWFVEFEENIFKWNRNSKHRNFRTTPFGNSKDDQS